MGFLKMMYGCGANTQVRNFKFNEGRIDRDLAARLILFFKVYFGYKVFSD